MTAVLERGTVPSTDRFGRLWSGKRVTVVGVGRSGRAAAQLLVELGAHVRATEASRSEQAQEARTALLALGVQEVELGGHSHHTLDGAEAIVVSPGVPESALPIRWGAEHGVPILSEIELAYLFCPASIVAITGTNGKSTAVTVLAAILNAAGRPAIACGNLGIPFTSVLSELTSQHVAVVEVSSFQLLWCQEFRPKIGVLLNLGINHLDRHEDTSAYLAAKARLFQRQTPEDWAVLNACDAAIAELAPALHAQIAWFGDNRTNTGTLILAAQTCRALTPNLQAVLQAARLLEVPDPLAWQIIREFRGLEHRMEPVETIRGVRFINDSKSTTPDSLRYALAHTQGEVVVIAGGRDKGMDFSALVPALSERRVRGVVLIGESRERLGALLADQVPHSACETLEQAIDAAIGLAATGTTVLFSPACASFDMFRDFEHRGRAFKSAVRARASSGQVVG